jgi:hypothetical protein
LGGLRGADDAELVGVEAGRREERRAPAASCGGDGAERGAAQGRVRGAWAGARRGRGAARGVAGAARAEEDREVLLPHALLRPRQQASRLLQEEAQGQHGMCVVVRCVYARFEFCCRGSLELRSICWGEIRSAPPLLQNLAAVGVTRVIRCRSGCC